MSINISFLTISFIITIILSMSEIVVFLIPIIIVALVALLLFVISLTRNKKDNGKKKKKLANRDRNSLLKEANRRLTQNPKDPEALLVLADINYEDKNYSKAIRSYEILLELCATNKDLNEFTITLRYGICALNLKQYDDAYKSLLICRSMKQDVFDVNYNLGFLEYQKKNYEKSASLFSQAKETQPEHVQTLKYLGTSLFKLRRFQEAASLFRKSLDLEPENKEILFSLGQAYHNMGQNDQAVKIFSHLRADPKLGPHASLYAGTININNRQIDKAIMDFEIGLKHKDMKKEIQVELMYRAAAAYINNQEIGKAIQYLNEIQNTLPAYRDVPELIKQYGELHKNENLQTYLIAPTSDFVTLCRKIVTSFYPEAKTKITDVSVYKNEHADILAEVSARKWEDVIIFRFIRTTGSVGELVLRDLYSRTKEVKAGRGFCITAGTFTEGAQEFVEARLIDLIPKEGLMKRMEQVSKSPALH